MRRLVRSRLDGALHARRRRSAEAVVRSLPQVRAILVVCLGNICRSPYAAARLEALGNGDFEARSCGLIEPGRHSPREVLNEARRRGLPLDGHRSRVLSSGSLDRVDLIVLVDPRHRRRLIRSTGRNQAPLIYLGDLDPLPVERRIIQDPWGSDPDTFTRVFDRIDRCLDVLVASLP